MMTRELPQELPSEYRQVYENLKGYINTSSHGGLKKQPIETIEGFAQQYLVALSMLSRLRANPNWKKYVPAFQNVLLEANILLYPEETVTLEKVWHYLWVTLPAQLWENRWYYFASTTIVLVTTVIGFIIVLQNFEMAPVFIPGGLRSSHEMEAYLFNPGAQHEMLTAGRNSSTDEKTLFAVALMINNIKVAITCFLTGVLFGLPTVLILAQTGLMLGTFPALFMKGDLYGLGAWLLPHGVPEVSAILFAGGAGLKLGLSLLQPTAGKASQNFRKALKSIIGTVLICVVLLIWAGIVESFVRQSTLSNPVRYMIAGFSLIPIILLFVRAFLAHASLRRAEAPVSAP